MDRTLKMIVERIGVAGLAGMALLALALAFSSLVVNPAAEKGALLQQKLGRAAPAAAAPGADKVAAVYQFLQKEEETTDWLAKLHGIGAATGVQLKSATYRTQKTDARIVRYEIALPVTGSYGQIRDFLKRALAEIPVLSLDQVTLKREGKSDGPIQADMRLTLHMVQKS